MNTVQIILLAIILMFSAIAFWGYRAKLQITLPQIQSWRIIITGTLLATLVFLVFPKEAKELIRSGTLILTLIASITILSIWSKADFFAKVAKVSAFLVLVIVLGKLFLPAVAEKIPESWKAAIREGRSNGIEFTLPSQTPPQGVYTGFDFKRGQKIRLEQVQPEMTTFSIVGTKTLETVSTKRYITVGLSDGGLYLRPEERKEAKIKITIY